MFMTTRAHRRAKGDNVADKTSTNRQQMDAVANADAIHDWPDEAGECAEDSWSIYRKNQDYRAHDDWTDSDLIELARMSRLQAIAVDLQNQLDDEGFVIMGGKSGKTPIENPAGRALSTVNGSINSIARRLGMTSASRGDRASRANRAKQEREAAAATTYQQDDEYDGQALM